MDHGVWIVCGPGTLIHALYFTRIHIYIYIYISNFLQVWVLPHAIITPYNDINLSKISIDHQTTTMKSPLKPSPRLSAAAHEGLREKRPSCGGFSTGWPSKHGIFLVVAICCYQVNFSKTMPFGLGKSVVPQIPLSRNSDAPSSESLPPKGFTGWNFWSTILVSIFW